MWEVLPLGETESFPLFLLMSRQFYSTQQAIRDLSWYELGTRVCIALAEENSSTQNHIPGEIVVESATHIGGGYLNKLF